MVLLAVQFVSVCVMLGQPIISEEQNIYLSLQVYKFLMLFKRTLVKYLLYVHSFHKILEMSSVPNSQSVGQFFYKKYSVSVQAVLRIFLKSTRFQFSRFYGYFRKVVVWILVGFEKFLKNYSVEHYIFRVQGYLLLSSNAFQKNFGKIPGLSTQFS